MSLFGKKNSKNVDFKSRLEHKLYLAREDPEPVFDLSDCDLKSVPSGVYTLCKVFRKERLYLQINQLTSLSGGGNLSDLGLLTVLDLHSNYLSNLSEDIRHLCNLKELYLHKNQLKYLPDSIGELRKLIVLDISNNKLRYLPTSLGCLKCLNVLNIQSNHSLKYLPPSLCLATRLAHISLDVDRVLDPPKSVTTQGTQAILRHLCQEMGSEYKPTTEAENESPASPDVCGYAAGFLQHLSKQESEVQDKLLALEKRKENVAQEHVIIEREILEQKEKEFELQSRMKQDRDKLLTDLVQQQNKLEDEVQKVQNQKELERIRLLQHLHEVENCTGKVIEGLLALNARLRQSSQLQEQDRVEYEMLCNQQKQTQALRRKEILEAMQELLKEECLRREKFQEYERTKAEVVKNSLSREVEWDQQVCGVVCERAVHQSAMVAAVIADEEAQKAAVGALLERGDVQTQNLIMQVKIVEQQLALLTSLELQRKNIDANQRLNEIADKRVALSTLLVDLLEQQAERRDHLLSTLHKIECSKPGSDFDDGGHSDFWLRQYQRLLDIQPAPIVSAQRSLDPTFVNHMVLSGVVHCLPFIANCNILTLTEEQLTEIGITSQEDRTGVLKAIKNYKEELEKPVESSVPTAPPISDAGNANECVVCMEKQYEVVFVPCGHVCTCMGCAMQLLQCPICRSPLERKICIRLS